MSYQKFYASPDDTFAFSCGAVGYRPGGPFDCLGPYAKVTNCRIAGTTVRRTVYATGYADTYFSVPACCKIGGKRINGYLTVDDDGSGRSIEFRPYDKHKLFVAAACGIVGSFSGVQS